jgi:hypothetical protein
MAVTAGELVKGRPDQRLAAVGVAGIVMAVLLALVLVALGAPIAVVALGAFGIIGLGLLSRPDAATLLFIGVLYLNVPVLAVRVHGAPEFVAIAAPLLLMIPLVTYVVFKREPLAVTPTLIWMVAYLAVLLVSTLASVNPAASVSAVSTYASEGLVLYVLVTNVVRTWSTLRSAIMVLLFVGGLMGGLSIFQELTQTYDNQYWGLAQTKEVDPLEEEADDSESPRLSGPIGSKNRYAQVMIVLLPLAIFALVISRTRIHRLLAATSGVAILGGMILTYSRGAAVALVILVIIAIALRFVRLRHALAVAAVLGLAVALVMPQYLGRLQSLTGVGELVSGAEGESDGAILGRATSNLASLSVFLEHPIVGVGPGQYVAEYSQQSANELGLRYFTGARRAHNLALEVAADTGVPGVIAFGGIFAVTLTGLWRVRRTWRPRNKEYAALATAMMLAVLGYMLTAVFLHLAYMRYLWLLIALANSLIWILWREAEQPPDAASA